MASKATCNEINLYRACIKESDKAEDDYYNSKSNENDLEYNGILLGRMRRSAEIVEYTRQRLERSNEIREGRPSDNKGNLL